MRGYHLSLMAFCPFLKKAYVYFSLFGVLLSPKEYLSLWHIVQMKT